MDALKSWGITVCFAALAAGIASIIAPSGKMEKIYKFAVSLFFLCCMLVPLFSIKNIVPKKIEINDETIGKSSKLSSAVQNQVGSVASQNLKTMINESLKAQGVQPQNITMQITKDNSGALDIKAITITLKKEDMPKKSVISDEIKSKYGLTVIIVEGEK